eukprot:TRINITY_DN29919_c0_g1_i1.p1 TRINITY_DN29919_c0_g1~~TRINITY_DN29919_c0_g1_i1.p1  ORF type:complete len:462 (+),score=140.03 TRINITY_DN29919_c0_g1_i1:62-1387(+)
MAASPTSGPSGLEVMALASVLTDLAELEPALLEPFRQAAEAFVREHGGTDALEQVVRRKRKEEHRLATVIAGASACAAAALSVGACALTLESGSAAAVVVSLCAAAVWPLVELKATQFNQALEKGEWPQPPPEPSDADDEDVPKPDSGMASVRSAARKAAAPGFFRAAARRSDTPKSRACRSPRGLLPSAAAALHSLTPSERARLVAALLAEPAPPPPQAVQGPPAGWRKARQSLTLVGTLAQQRRRSARMSLRPQDVRGGSPRSRTPSAFSSPGPSPQSAHPADGDDPFDPPPMRGLAIAAQARFGEVGGFDYQGRARESLRPALRRAAPEFSRVLWAEFLRRCKRVLYCEDREQPGIGAGAPADADDRVVAELLVNDPERLWDVPGTLKLWFATALGLADPFRANGERGGSAEAPTVAVTEEPSSDSYSAGMSSSPRSA